MAVLRLELPPNCEAGDVLEFEAIVPDPIMLSDFVNHFSLNVKPEIIVTPGNPGRNAIAEQRFCESRADEIGFTILISAGYNPFDAAAGFGRLEMLMGDTSTGVLGRLAAMGKRRNHQ